jgi:hypothetical protein
MEKEEYLPRNASRLPPIPQGLVGVHLVGLFFILILLPILVLASRLAATAFSLINVRLITRLCVCVWWQKQRGPSPSYQSKATVSVYNAAPEGPASVLPAAAA